MPCLQSVLGRWERAGGRGRGSLFLVVPLCSVCHPAGYLRARWAYLGQSHRLGSDCALLTMLTGSKVRKSGCTREKKKCPILL